jgi:hypothetical protein
MDYFFGDFFNWTFCFCRLLRQFYQLRAQPNCECEKDENGLEAKQIGGKRRVGATAFGVLRRLFLRVFDLLAVAARGRGARRADPLSSHRVKLEVSFASCRQRDGGSPDNAARGFDTLG